MDLTLQHIIDNQVALRAELKRRQGIVRDYVRSVARQYSTGLYLFGRPGTAKTRTVRDTLENEVRELYTYQRRSSDADGPVRVDRRTPGRGNRTGRSYGGAGQ